MNAHIAHDGVINGDLLIQITHVTTAPTGERTEKVWEADCNEAAAILGAVCIEDIKAINSELRDAQDALDMTGRVFFCLI